MDFCQFPTGVCMSAQIRDVKVRMVIEESQELTSGIPGRAQNGDTVTHATPSSRRGKKLYAYSHRDANRLALLPGGSQIEIRDGRNDTAIEPCLEEVVEVLAGHFLGYVDEILG